MATIADMSFIQGRLIALYPNYHPADLGLVSTIWLEILGDLPAELLKMAIMQYSSEAHDFAPSAGTVRDYCMRLQAKAAGMPDAHQAYDEVIRKPELGKRIGEFGTLPDGTMGYLRAPVEWSHPIVEYVARLMGWPKRFPTNEPSIDRAQFIKAYDAQMTSQMTEAARLPVVQKYIEHEARKALPEISKLAKQLEGK